MRKKRKIFFNVKSTAERGHWRSGRLWPMAGTDVPLREVTCAMMSDPRLVITEVVEEEESDAE